MLSKVMFLLAIGAALALDETPTELHEYFYNVSVIVRNLEAEARFNISSYEKPLRNRIVDAENDLNQNITLAEEPYWEEITSLEDAAETKGQNISECVDIGNNQLYALNKTTRSTASQGYANYYRLGEDIILSSWVDVNTVVEPMDYLGKNVANCTDDDCVPLMMWVVTNFFDSAMEDLPKANEKSSNYLFVELPVYLSQYNLDFDAYQANYTVFLGNVTDCIDAL